MTILPALVVRTHSMQLVMTSFGRALWSQLHFRMLLLTVLPFLLSLLLWGVVLWLGLQPLIDWLHGYFVDNNLFQSAASVLGWFGLGAIKTVLVPLLAMWLLLPLMVVTALIFVGVMAMPAVATHVATRHYPQLAQRRGGSLAGSLSASLGAFLIFAMMWLVTLPLNAVPLMAFVLQPVLWGWLTYRVMAYDALAEHASADERRALMRAHRWPMLAIGVAAGAMAPRRPCCGWAARCRSFCFRCWQVCRSGCMCWSSCFPGYGSSITRWKRWRGCAGRSPRVTQTSWLSHNAGLTFFDTPTTTPRAQQWLSV